MSAKVQLPKEELARAQMLLGRKAFGYRHLTELASICILDGHGK
jgi:hypothetical protein